MNFNEWMKKYIPYGHQNKVLKRAGLTLNQVPRWRKGVKPNTSSIIFLAKTLSIMFDYDFQTIVIEGIKAAAKDELWIDSLENTTQKR